MGWSAKVGTEAGEIGVFKLKIQETAPVTDELKQTVDLRIYPAHHIGQVVLVIDEVCLIDVNHE